MALSTADTALAAGNADNIVIQHHKDGAWTKLPTLVDFGASTATAKVDSLSLFALTILEPQPTLVPPPGQITLPTAPPEPTHTPITSSPVVDHTHRSSCSNRHR